MYLPYDIQISITDIKEFVTIVTLCVGSYVALRGLNAWKNQFKSHEYTLAKNILIQAYKYREAMKTLRNSAVWTYEYPSFDGPTSHLGDARKKYLQMAYVYQKRWDRVEMLKPELWELLLESEVLWGQDLKNIFVDIFRLEFKVYRQVSAYLASLDDANDYKEKFEKDLIYDSFKDETDSFRQQFNPLLAEVEKYIKSKLKM